jgi:hypothetical protein
MKFTMSSDVFAYFTVTWQPLSCSKGFTQSFSV